MSHRYVLPKYMIPVNGQWKVITEDYLQKCDPTLTRNLDYVIGEYQRNPLAFFLPHGVKRGKTNDGLLFMNDYKNDLLLLLASKQTGKSFSGAARTLMQLLPCDPSWPCFTQHGLDYHPWAGPQIAIVASFSWDNVQIVWDAYRRLAPRKELARYSEGWGRFEGERGTAKSMPFGDGKPKHLEFACGSKIIFLCYTQDMTHWEGRQCDLAHLDEQIPENLFDALTSRQVTRGNYTPIFMTLSGYVIPGRPDTGAAGWIKTKLIDKKITKSRKFKQYHISVPSVPDAIISEDKKRKMYHQWVTEPKEKNDWRILRAAEAVYWGGWEVGGGTVLDEWNTDVHYIEPFDYMKLKPTLYRFIDHGRSNDPCAGVLIAMMPWGDAVVVKEYYEYNRSCSQNAIAIVEDLSGNKRAKIDTYEDENSVWSIYEEVYSEIEPYASEMDSRSFGKKSEESSRTIGQLYNHSGCFCTPASGQPNDIVIPLLKEWLTVRPERKHIDVMLGRKKESTFGGAKLYVFNTCENTKREIENWIIDPKTAKPSSKVGTADHLISCLKFFAARPRDYLEEADPDDVEENDFKPRSSITGY